MARKHAGDLLNILSDPGNREGLVSGPAPIQVTPRSAPTSFPGIVGLGAVTGTGVPKLARRAALADDDERAPRAFRLDWALAGLLGMLVTNIVSFTLGARAGRQSVDPATLTTLQASGPATTVVEVKPAEPATPAVAESRPSPGDAPAKETGPMLGAQAPAPPPIAPAPAPVPAPAPAATEDMAGKYVVRCITLPYDERGKQLAARICTFLDGEGVGPALARPVGGNLVVETGRFERFDAAETAKAKVRKLRVGYNSFGDAYVIQRTGK